MMGEQARTESLFYYFRLEEQIPEDHLLRLLDRYIDFSFVRERLKTFYSSTGRPSIDPEVLLRLLLVGYLYGITSERRLLNEVRMHLAYRRFTRLDLNAEIPDHSTFSRIGTGAFASPEYSEKCSRRSYVAVSRLAWFPGDHERRSPSHRIRKSHQCHHNKRRPERSEPVPRLEISDRNRASDQQCVGPCHG
jgi:transposase